MVKFSKTRIKFSRRNVISIGRPLLAFGASEPSQIEIHESNVIGLLDSKKFLDQFSIQISDLIVQ